MSSDDVSAYEDDALIQGKGEDIGVIYDKAPQKYVLLKRVWNCIIIVLLLANLFVILGSFAWYYISVASPLVSISSIATLSRLSNYYGIGASYLPNNTIHTLYDHDAAVGITNEEEYILSMIFGLFDFDHDDCWNLNEFKSFIDVAIEPEHNFDTMDLDNNSVITMKEIYFLIEAFDDTDIYECDETDQILYDIFGYGSDDGSASSSSEDESVSSSSKDNDDRSLFYEYIGQLWLYQLDSEGIGLISKNDYVEYIDEEEWNSHNYNGDDCVNFTEFRDSFFSSIYYISWKESMQYLVDDQDGISSIYQQLDAISDEAISSLELQTTPHAFDANITAYHANDPSVSLLYSFPNVYFARNLMDTNSARRRLQLVSTLDLPMTMDAIYTNKETMTMDNGDIKVSLTDDNDDTIFTTTDDLISLLTGNRWRKYLRLCGEKTVTDSYGRELCRYNERYFILNDSYIAITWGDNIWNYIDDDIIDAGLSITYDDDGYAMDADTGKRIRVEAMPTSSPTPSPICGRGCARPGCFGDAGVVDVLQTINGEVQSQRLKDVAVGEFVFDGNKYTKIIAVEKGEAMEMIQLFVNKTYITLTSDHLLFDDENKVIRSGDLKIGDKIYNDFVVPVHKIKYNVYETPSTPITMSGKIQVNGLKASCYIRSGDFADAAHKILAPLRFISQYMNEYYPSVIIESFISDVIQLQDIDVGLIHLIGIHPICDLMIVFLGGFIIYGKHLIIYGVSLFM